MMHVVMLLSLAAANEQLIRATELRYNLPEGLMVAIQKVESNGNPNAFVRKDGVSNHSSYGLFQIQLPTARFMGFKGKPKDLFKPAINVEYAGKYLHYIITNISHGDPARTLKCWNAGPHSKACKKDSTYVDKVFNTYLKGSPPRPGDSE